MRRVGIFGAGAIGSFLAARLTRAHDAEVTLLARGAQLAAVRSRGLTLLHKGDSTHTQPRVRDAAEPGEPPDFLIICLKAYSLQDALPQLRPLVGPQTCVVAAVNGIPWWYCHGIDGPFRDRRVEAVDPDGALGRALPPNQALGCILYPAAELREPGVVEHVYGDRITLGEPDGSQSPRAQELGQLLQQAGLRAPVRDAIRTELWVKLWGNLAFNPVSALTGATLVGISNDPGAARTVRAMMLEGQEVAARLGVTMPISLQKRLDGARSVGEHKTSMLQDLERGRALELDALLGAVVELADWVRVSVPTCRVVYDLLKLRASSAPPPSR